MNVKTKSRIIEAAIRVFNADSSAPLHKVANNAEVTRRTLHRYFRDRNELVTVCAQEMELSCKKAMIKAIDSSDEPLIQLKNMLFAGIDCGSKYSFFYNLHQGKDHNHRKSNKNCADYDYIYENFTQIIMELQTQNKISKQMTVDWIQNLHAGIISSTVNSEANDETTKLRLKEWAWKSFSKGISP